MYLITQAQWDVIDPSCKSRTTDGRIAFREFDTQTGRDRVVPVRIVEHPPAVVVPAHYASIWPSDPRD
jgi:hypothetical protein